MLVNKHRIIATSLVGVSIATTTLLSGCSSASAPVVSPEEMDEVENLIQSSHPEIQEIDVRYAGENGGNEVIVAYVVVEGMDVYSPQDIGQIAQQMEDAFPDHEIAVDIKDTEDAN